MNIEIRLSQAVSHFWNTRTKQGTNQGSVAGSKDKGTRSMVTGGKQLDGFTELFADLMEEEDLPRKYLHAKSTTLPGYYRPSKDWDFVVVVEDQLVATIEFKSHVGPSFGNNFNNRVEEALGNATDLNTAFREGAFRTSSRPWIGYLMLLEEHERSLGVVRISEPHFPVFPEFSGTSYADRSDLFCTRLVRERLYDSACLLMSTESGGLGGKYTEPNPELSFLNFITSLQGRIRTTVKRMR
ncbi:MAG: PaeR7I family type II restriction endonuclease [Alkalispirochaeta sp.]